MKILMLLDHVFPPDTRVENEISALSAAGHEVHLLCFASEGAPLEETTAACKIHRRTISKFVYKSSVGALKYPFYFHFWKKITRRAFEDFGPFDVIHVHDLPLARIGLEMKRRFGCEFILDLHENWPVLLQLSQHTQTFLGRLLSSNLQWVAYEKEMCREADKIIVVVDEAKRRISQLGVDEKKIEVVSNTLDLQQFDVVERRCFSTDDFHILYVGGINYHRGIQYVVEAVALLKRRGVKVVFDLVGDGRYLSEIKKLIEERDVKDFVVVHGFKKYTQIPHLYEEASLAVIPHVKSGHTDNTIPHKIFQYMYAEIPMLVSNCDPLERLVKENHCGLSYQYDNPEVLADIIDDLYHHREKLNSFLGESRKAVLERYNWSVDGKRLVDFESKKFNIQ